MKFQIVAAMNIRVDSADVVLDDVLGTFESDHNLHQLAMMIRQGQAKLVPMDDEVVTPHSDTTEWSGTPDKPSRRTRTRKS